MATTPYLKYAELASYDDLVGALEDVTDNANCGDIKWTKPLSRRFDQAGGQANFSAYLHLRNWKWYGGSRKNGLHILLQIREKICCADKALLESVVQIDHYSVEGRTATLLESIHYDFGGAQDRHPLFHAQLCRTHIALDPLVAREIEFRYDIDAGRWNCFGRARIPTSDMTLASVLLCLAADHFEKYFFNQFRKRALELQEKLPHPAIESLAKSIEDKRDHLGSSHWFAHMESPP